MAHLPAVLGLLGAFGIAAGGRRGSGVRVGPYEVLGLAVRGVRTRRHEPLDPQTLSRLASRTAVIPQVWPGTVAALESAAIELRKPPPGVSTGVYFPREKLIRLGPSPRGLDLLVHESMHHLDAHGRRVCGTAGHRPLWHSHDTLSCVRAPVLELREALQGHPTWLKERRAEATSWIPRPLRRQLVARDRIPMDELIGLYLSHANLRAAPDEVADLLFRAIVPFSGGIRWALLSGLLRRAGVPGIGPTPGSHHEMLGKLMSLRPRGVPLGMEDETDQREWLRSASAEDAQLRRERYYLSHPQVFARWMDLETRRRAPDVMDDFERYAFADDLPLDIADEFASKADAMTRELGWV